MQTINSYDVIIIGGSYAGLSAAMALGRALRKVLIIDGGEPCNQQTPHSHNFLTRDGETPAQISSIAKEQVLAYSTVTWMNGFAQFISKKDSDFEVFTLSGGTFQAKKIILATGIKDLFPEVKGLKQSWGISVIHCPYCHGYEVRNQKTGILANGDIAFDFAKLIFNWTKELTLFTNGKADLSEMQKQTLNQKGIQIEEAKLIEIQHENGKLNSLILENKSIELKALYARIPFEQRIPTLIDFSLNKDEQGFLQVNPMGETSEKGIFACGDNVSRLRSVANAVAGGNLVGAIVNHELTFADFEK